MIALMVFGNMVEQVWGAKKMLMFYFAAAIGAAFIHQIAMGVEIYQVAGTAFPNADLGMSLRYNSMVGASGAVYGLIVAAAMYFPNTELYIYAILPIKVKWLAALAIGFDIISVFQNNPDDHTAHFAHLGGALIGFIIVYFWKKKSSTFY